ncbi:MAG: hypothetical protein KDJ52_01275 [Anaerolineae bacterium]|nr:hypothetical protein [Anaerolineae bacterium]
MATTNILPQSPGQGNLKRLSIKYIVASIRRALRRKMCNRAVSSKGGQR